MTRNSKATVCICAFVTICMTAGFFSASLFGGQRRYEIRPEITLPEYKTEVDRVVDLYERIMDDYIDVTNDRLAALRVELQDLSQTLNSIDKHMSQLALQVETIQRKLGIEVMQAPTQSDGVPDKSVILDQH